MKGLFSSSPIWASKGLAVVRIIFGFLLVYHGWEVFSPETMAGYTTWDLFKGPMASPMVYTGKSSELVAGVFILVGLFTRISSVLVMCTFTFITFFVGHGKFWYDDQHPFMFFLFGLLFFFTGPGAWNLSDVIFKKSEN
jgi:putative oxidoreductase